MQYIVDRIVEHGYYKGTNSAWTNTRSERRRSLLDDYDLGQHEKDHDPQQTLTLGPTR